MPLLTLQKLPDKMSGTDDVLQRLLKEEAECIRRIGELTERLNRTRQMIELRRGAKLSDSKRSERNMPVLSHRFANIRGLWPALRAVLEENGCRMKRDDLFREMWIGGAFLNAKRPEKNFQLSLDTQASKGNIRVSGETVSLVSRERHKG